MRENKKTKTIILLTGTAIALIAGFFSSRVLTPFFETKSNKESCRTLELENNASKLVTKVIDGDTFLIEGGYSVRILGIDAPERGERCYERAKKRLKDLILDKRVRLEKGSKDKDRWCRYLRFVFLDKKDIGLTLVKEGLAVARLGEGSEKYSRQLWLAEKEARENKVGCKWGEEVSKDLEEVSSQKGYKWKRLTPQNIGFDVVSACEAKQYLKRELIVEGKIVDTYQDPKSKTVFLNFGQAFPNQCFTAVIFSSYLSKFKERPQDYYRGKTVRVMGKVREYKGKPEIILESPQQIEIPENF